jgi:hypothetical protein
MVTEPTIAPEHNRCASRVLNGVPSKYSLYTALNSNCIYTGGADKQAQFFHPLDSSVSLHMLTGSVI